MNINQKFQQVQKAPDPQGSGAFVSCAASTAILSSCSIYRSQKGFAFGVVATVVVQL